MLYAAHYAIKYGFIRLAVYFYWEPVFRSRCSEVGKNLQLWTLPYVSGQPKIYIGNNVNIYGKMSVRSGSTSHDPILLIGSGVEIGNRVTFVVNQGIVIEDYVNIAQRTTIMDSDWYSLDPFPWARENSPNAKESKPIRICTRAWISLGSFITKSVTIGEGAIVGSNSVVVTDVPAFSVVAGNPARVILKDTRIRPKP